MGFSGQPFFVRINRRVWVIPEGVPEFLQCTAMTKRRKRCGNPLDHGQMNAYSWLKVEGGYVEGFDYDATNGEPTEQGDRYLVQRCELHFDTDAPSAAEPDWVAFDAAEHASRIVSAERALSYMTGAPPPEPVPAILSPSPENDAVPTDVLQQVMERRDLSFGGRGLWAMLVSHHWCCEDDRTVEQLQAHRPQDADEIDTLLAELSAAGLVEVNTSPGGDRVVSIDLAALDVAGTRESFCR